MSTLAFVPVKNAASFLPAFLNQLEQLEDIGQIVFSYGESKDATLDILKSYRDQTEHKIRVKRDPPMGEVLSSGQIGLLYADMQRRIKEKPEEYPESHIALLDADVMRMPKDLLVKLRKHDKDIVAPYVWTLFHSEPCRLFYDTYVFRYKGYRFHPYRPPLNDGELLQLDSVGTCFLVDKQVFLDVPYGDPYPHMKFCNEAREKGYEVWADPGTSIYHVDLTRFGQFHYEVDVIKAMQRGDRNPHRFADNTPYIKDDGSLCTPVQLGGEYMRLYTLGVLP